MPLREVMHKVKLLINLFNNKKIMKKFFLSAMLAVASIGFMNAQQVQNAIGLKFGWGTEISYQHALGNANRLELNLGLNSFGDDGAFTLSGAYQWVWDLSQLAPGFQWYAGVGAMCGFRSRNDNSTFYLWAIGNIGIEYNFDFPLQLALDWTPAIRLTPSAGNFGYNGIRFAARWRF